MRTRTFIVLILATISLAKQTASDIPVISFLADYNASSAAYYVQSDDLGSCGNGVNNASSILVANGYNGIVDGDWRLDLSTSTETRDVQISCNSADSGGCNDWLIDPVPVVNPDGTTSPGQACARLNLANTHGFNNLTNDGDFYLTFHFHVTRL